MFIVRVTNRFEKQLKLCLKRGLDISQLQTAINILAETGTLPSKYKPHKLTGNYKGYWEAHIQPDWLLIWLKNDTELILTLIATGIHSDLF